MNKIICLTVCLVFLLAGCGSKVDDGVIEKTLNKKPLTTDAKMKDLMTKYKGLVKAKKLEEALAVIDEAIELKGANRGILGIKHELLMKLKKFEAALAVALRRDEVAKRKTPWNCISIADTYLKLNNTEMALKYLSIAVNERNFNNLHHLQGETYDPLKEHKDYIALIEKVKELIGIGKKATDFMVKLIDGTEYILSAQKGNVVLVDFWATWCPPCRKELPHLKKLYTEVKNKGFKIIGISLDTDEKKHKTYTEEKGIDWDLNYTGKGWIDDRVKLYNVSNIPSTWLIDRQGNLRYFDISGDDLSKAVKKLLAEKEESL